MTNKQNKNHYSKELALNLTDDNYYSNEAHWQYMSVSQYKQFMKCEAATLAELKKEWQPDSDKTALLVGNYVHSYFESKEAHEKFKEENKDKMFSSRKPHGLLKAFQIAEQMIERIEREPLFNHIWNGHKEHIVQGELFGVQWKGKIDLLNIEEGYFVDLKTTQDMHKRFFNKDHGGYVSFVEEYGYIIQMAIYAQLLEQEFGKPFTPFIYVVTKQTPSDVAAIEFTPIQLDYALADVERTIKRVSQVKHGEAKPDMCDQCEYCRENKQLDGFIKTDDLLN